ncbi:MAG TPA: DUF4292 domain-containing protein [Spirochaetota bacterium]|nr:DUF4292 domain-containing protein [Spirochaetota bacterium]
MKRAVILVFCLFLVSCAVRQEVTRDLGPGTVGQGAVGPEPREEQDILSERIGEYNAKLVSLSGTAIVVFRDEESTLSFRSEIGAREGANFVRLDLNDLVFKTPLATVIKNGDEVFTYVHQKMEYYQTAAEEADFGMLLGFDIPVKLLVQSLLARVYIPEGEIEARRLDDLHIEITAQEEKEVVRFRNEDIPEEVMYTYKDSTGQETVYSVSFEQFEDTGVLEFPLVIKIKSQNRSLEIRYTTVKPNAAVSVDRFLPGNGDLGGYTRRLW